MKKRAVQIFVLMIMGLSVLVCRLFYLSSSQELSVQADRQRSYTLTVAQTRGVFYDCNMRPLVGNDIVYKGAVVPSEKAVAALAKILPVDSRQALQPRLQKGQPFLIDLPSSANADGIEQFAVKKRYGENQLAQHLLGYLDCDGKHGVVGLEKAYDSFLSEASGSLTVTYTVDARRRPLPGGTPEVKTENYDSRQGVVLTLDRDVQAVVEKVLAQNGERAAAVVLDVETGAIRGCASAPTYDPQNIAASLNDSNTPLYNRALGAYNVGSVFKLCVAAAALEEGDSAGFMHVCTGTTKIGDRQFSCSDHKNHGLVDLRKALEVSCNTYFVNLAQKLGGDRIYDMAVSIGFGASTALANSVVAAAGTLPERASLISPAVVANFSFGQGDLTATPVQVANMVAIIARGGKTVQPRLVQALVDDSLAKTQEYPAVQGARILSEQSCQTLREYMIATVNEGTGAAAKPEEGGAGGKTATAETSAVIDGIKQDNAWFAGFFPAEKPQYAVAVMVEGGVSGGTSCAPLFKQIADGISALPQN